MKQPSYCLPIIKPQRAQVLEIIDAHMDGFRWFEVWLDYVDDPDKVFLDELVGRLGDRLIVTFRRQELEPPRMSPARRKELLKALAGTPALVDLDILTQTAEIGWAEGVNLIASFHDYRGTPDTLQLRKIIDTMETYRPAVYKLSTLCRTEGDAVRLFQLLLELKAKGVRAIVSGMGEYGVPTRIFAPLWGSEMAFAPLDEDGRSAPGQLTKDQLEEIYKELE